MLHQLAGGEAKIVHHLHGLCVLQDNMFLFTSTLEKVTVDQFPEGSPLVTVAHDEKVVSTGYQIIRDIRGWTMAVDGTLLIDEGFD